MGDALSLRIDGFLVVSNGVAGDKCANFCMLMLVLGVELHGMKSQFTT